MPNILKTIILDSEKPKHQPTHYEANIVFVSLFQKSRFVFRDDIFNCCLHLVRSDHNPHAALRLKLLIVYRLKRIVLKIVNGSCKRIRIIDILKLTWYMYLWQHIWNITSVCRFMAMWCFINQATRDYTTLGSSILQQYLFYSTHLPTEQNRKSFN